MKNIYSLAKHRSSASLFSQLKTFSVNVKLFVVLAILGFSFGANSQTVVYNIGVGGLVNQPNNCGSSGNYNPCNGSAYGASWVSTNTGIPTSVGVHFYTGVNCNGAGLRNKTLNGSADGTFNITAGAGCFCSGVGTTNTVNLNPALYNTGGTNTFTISGGSSCEGFDPDSFGGGIFARVTVQYAPNPCNSISSLNCYIDWS